MTCVSVTSGPILLQAPMWEVWAAVGDFMDLSWLDPNIVVEVVEGHPKRRLLRVGDNVVVNELESQTPSSFSYSLVQSQLPLSRYLATFEVKGDEDGSSCVLEWYSLAETSGPAEEASAALQPVFNAAARVLEARFNGGRASVRTKVQLGASVGVGAGHGFQCQDGETAS